MSSAAFQKLSPYYHGFRTWVSQYPPLYAGLSRVRRLFKYTYPESALAHRYLDGLRGIEIGPGAFNPFGLDTLNINCGLEGFAEYESALAKQRVKLDLISVGDQLPFPDAHWDFVLNSHVVEHFFNPIRALQEWYRIIKPGGYIFVIVPHKDRTPDKTRPRTTLAELIDRHASGKPNIPTEHHHCVWIPEDFLELCAYLKLPVVESQDPDDKAGNGFTIVIRKPAV